MEAHIKTPSEIEHMKEACRITGDALKKVEEKIRAGMTTQMIDNIVRDYIHSCRAKCSFKNYQGFPANRQLHSSAHPVLHLPARPFSYSYQ